MIGGEASERRFKRLEQPQAVAIGHRVQLPGKNGGYRPDYTYRRIGGEGEHKPAHESVKTSLDYGLGLPDMDIVGKEWRKRREKAVCTRLAVGAAHYFGIIEIRIPAVESIAQLAVEQPLAHQREKLAPHRRTRALVAQDIPSRRHTTVDQAAVVVSAGSPCAEYRRYSATMSVQSARSSEQIVGHRNPCIGKGIGEHRGDTAVGIAPHTPCAIEAYATDICAAELTAKIGYRLLDLGCRALRGIDA